ncbi:DUF456 domain-containing protein [uncultured Desulfovibrio sp.]|uniref:DUF456 domain-containing protein n=1 Tax=uncultured Desulfovibrio sp. TaxID=167968 RepID=UPI0026165D7C|nr:DUF456 domain-containing protein [uncultured Desulfovibrio sp.]
MDFLPFPVASLLAGAFITLLGFVLLLNVFGLPANWVLLGLVALWKVIHPGADMGAGFWVLMVGIAVSGEALEMGLQVLKARRYGSSASGTFAGMLGAIAGAILLAPLFFGLGALVGALAGAWTGCFLMETLKGRPLRESLDAAFGAMVGRFLGTVCKCGAGGCMLALAAGRIWPALPPVQDSGEPAGMALYLLCGLC